ncbi:hypothetical protein [Aquimarina muelleri]|uniref:HTH domain-containing protein n=1 Tax=Aquimarina muelleri TaxID=279356 RepID=A0A918JTM0_9FLAO|nr:hypothetical protein [Aquimarina muelleri]MCX2761562.1 hypothetical protein [Aquimarina muelleri]GGX07843.1 hypothetical protein GCM10007384_07010 [Aquimarina muelleri]
MDIMIRQIQIIERMDQFIRMRATGGPDEFASRMGISKTKLYRTIQLMKKLNAPVAYDIAEQSYVYAEAGEFTFGFCAKNKSIREFGVSL